MTQDSAARECQGSPAWLIWPDACEPAFCNDVECRDLVLPELTWREREIPGLVGGAGFAGGNVPGMTWGGTIWEQFAGVSRALGRSVNQSMYWPGRRTWIYLAGQVDVPGRSCGCTCKLETEQRGV